jgi:alkanesulfonate monooxygenase SsuD/methylene tetrahydromethanopterin reductase-like flavin-dependent oxidoreductase (luciferase family)
MSPMMPQIGFSVPGLTAVRRPEPESREQVASRFERAYLLCALAEENGFDFATIGQHRFSPYTVDSSAPLVTLAALAARTSTLRLVTNILVLPQYDPVEIAEQANVVDEVSGGRLTLGVGLGYREYEYAGARVPYRERGRRLEDSIAALRQLWQPGPQELTGRYARPELTVSPPVSQPGGPPIWIGATQGVSIERAARIADGWIAGSPRPLRFLRPLIDQFRAAVPEGRRSAFVLDRLVGVGASMAEVERDWLPAIVAAYREYVRVGIPVPAPEFDEKLRRGDDIGLADLPEDQFVFGTPDVVADRLTEIVRQTGCEHLQCDFGRAAAAEQFEVRRRAIQLIGAEVLPRMRKSLV